MKRTPLKLFLRQFWKSKNGILWFFLTVFAVITIAFYFWKFFEIQNIIVISDGRQIQLRGYEELYTTPLIFVSENQLRSRLLKQNEQIQNLRIKKIYPNKLEIHVIKYRPQVVLKVGGGYFILSFDGRILKREKKLTAIAPLMTYYQSLVFSAFQSGDYITLKDIQTALFFSKKLQEIGVPLKDIAIVGVHMIRLGLGDAEIITSTERDPKIQAYQIETLLRQFKIEGKSYKKIDVRFDKPVITIK